MKFGVFGATGRWGQVYMRTLAELGAPYGFEGVPLNREHAQKLPDDVGAVIIATPPETHFDLAMSALEQGRPVLVEKPVTLSSLDTLRLRAAEKQHGGSVSVSYQHRFSAGFTLLRNSVAGKELRSVDCKGHNDGPARYYSALWDWAPHDLSMVFGDLFTPKQPWEVLFAFRKTTRNGSAWHFRLSVGDTYVTFLEGNIFRKKEKSIRVVAEGAEYFYDDQQPKRLIINGEIVPTVNPLNVRPMVSLLHRFHAYCLFRPKIPEGHSDLDLSVTIARVLEKVESVALYGEIEGTL